MIGAKSPDSVFPPPAYNRSSMLMRHPAHAQRIGDVGDPNVVKSAKTIREVFR
jgi:hypothetical protein